MPTRPDLRTSRRWLQGLSGPGGCECSSGHQRAPPVQAEWGSLCRNLRVRPGSGHLDFGTTRSRTDRTWPGTDRLCRASPAESHPEDPLQPIRCRRGFVERLPAPQQRPTLCVSRVDAGRTSAGRRARRWPVLTRTVRAMDNGVAGEAVRGRLVSTCSSGCLCLGHGVLQKEDSHVVTEGAVRHVGSGPREQRVQGLLQVACGEHGGDAQEG